MENGERSTTMTEEQTLSLVLKDEAGNYFVLPQELLEQCRVPEEHKAEIEHLIAEQEDVQGYRPASPVGGPPSYSWFVVADFFRSLGYRPPMEW